MVRIRKIVIVAVVLAVCVMGILLYFAGWADEDKEKAEKKAARMQVSSLEQTEEGADKERLLSKTEEMYAVMSEEGVPTMCYNNRSCVTGVPDLIIPAKKDGMEVKNVNLTWLHSDENNRVTYLRSVIFEEGIEVLESIFCYVKNLKKVVIPKSMKKIPDMAFEDCQKDVTLYVVKESYGEKYAKRNKLKYQIS